MTGGDQNTFLTPANPVVRPQSRRGSAAYPAAARRRRHPALCAGRGGVVRDFVFDVAQEGFVGPDRTLLARHLFEHRRIVSWTYAQSPYSIVWCVMDDGALLSLTFLREHDIWGWTRHETRGEVQSVVAVPEDEEDAVYITVKRRINGRDRYFHERMARRSAVDHTDWFFADCALRIDNGKDSQGNLVMHDEYTGLDHLEGEEVAVLADGNVIEGVSVSRVVLSSMRNTTTS